MDTGGTPGDTKLLDLNFQTCFQGKFRVPKMKAIHHFLSRLKINDNSPLPSHPQVEKIDFRSYQSAVPLVDI